MACRECEHPVDEHDETGCHALDLPAVGLVNDCACGMKPLNESRPDVEPSLRDFTGTPEQYVDLISEAWDWNYGTMFVTEMRDSWLHRYWEIKLVTGGWSENEETLDIIEGGGFHMRFWESIHRGGLHVYHVPAAQWTTVFEQLGQL